MHLPSTKKVVDHIVKDYETAARAMNKVMDRHPDTEGSFLNSDNLDADAVSIQDAYDKGLFDDITPEQLQPLMEKYGAVDIYHLTASYFNSTGHILNVVPDKK